MTVEQNGKVLYHIQSVNWNDQAYDIFVWARYRSNVTENLRQLFLNDYEDIEEPELNDLIENASVYTVYAVNAETVKGVKNA